MRFAVKATRLELLRLKRRLRLAKKGHKLLLDKQEQLMNIFLPLFNEARTLRNTLREKMPLISQTSLAARSLTPLPRWKKEVLSSQIELTPSLNLKKLLNITAPEIKLEKKDLNPFIYSFISITTELDKAVSEMISILPLLLRAAQVEKSITLLSFEIERTRRRVNALEYVLIPRLEETIKYIYMKLAELERANLTRLMRVKELVRQH